MDESGDFEWIPLVFVLSLEESRVSNGPPRRIFVKRRTSRFLMGYIPFSSAIDPYLTSISRLRSYVMSMAAGSLRQKKAWQTCQATIRSQPKVSLP